MRIWGGNIGFGTPLTSPSTPLLSGSLCWRNSGQEKNFVKLVFVQMMLAYYANMVLILSHTYFFNAR